MNETHLPQFSINHKAQMLRLQPERLCLFTMLSYQTKEDMEQLIISDKGKGQNNEHKGFYLRAS